ncbi:hypothetical protein TorRG33x02_003760 [Trema orientale]|uniref:Uncharacterized protein n=1 Tax=Trema orientale TaxID=63057 RepID=A0A2P5G218_TREOI|nr:hypothetical protein TorRG33x02_003760 [Trema orientale]
MERANSSTTWALTISFQVLSILASDCICKNGDRNKICCQPQPGFVTNMRGGCFSYLAYCPALLASSELH